MPYATPYDRQASFTLIAQENPAEPYTGTDLDIEFNAVKVAIDETQARMALIQRDDGQLANGSVGPDQLAPALEIGVNPPTAWEAEVTYTQFSTVFVGPILYRATADHTSDVFETDLVAGLWVLVADFLGDFDPETLNDGDVTTAKIADGAVTTEKIATGAVNANRLASNAVVTAKIADGAVTEDKIAAGAVVAGKIATNAVTSGKIQDEAVTLAKMQTIATGKVLGRTTAETGAVELLDVSAITGISPSLMTTRGDIIYRDASAPARLAKGTAGQVLTMGANDPAWSTPTGTLTRAAKTSSQAITSTSMVNVTDLSFAIGANETWTFMGALAFTASTASAKHISVNGPASPSSVAFLATSVESDDEGASRSANITAYDGDVQVAGDKQGLTSFSGTIANGANAGTVILRARVVSGTLTIRGGWLMGWKS